MILIHGLYTGPSSGQAKAAQTASVLNCKYHLQGLFGRVARDIVGRDMLVDCSDSNGRQATIIRTGGVYAIVVHYKSNGKCT